MSWWNLSPCSSLTSPRFSGKKIQVWLQKVDFQTHIASHSFVRIQQDLHNILIVRCFVISYEVLANPLKWQPRISFSLIQVFIELFVLHQFPDLRSLNCASLTFGNFVLKYSNPRPVLSMTCKTFVTIPSFMCKGGRKFFSGRTRGGLTTFFSSGVSDVRLGHSLFT